MKKIVLRILSLVLVVVSLFTVTGCNEQKPQFSNKVECAPCTLQDIWGYNELLWTTFFPIHLSAKFNTSTPKVVVNGEEWVRLQYITTELTEGQYTIKFYTDSNYTVSTMKDGQRVEIPFVREVTLYVTISSNYADIYDMEYRRQNGLWIHPETQDWYAQGIKDMEKL